MKARVLSSHRKNSMSATHISLEKASMLIDLAVQIATSKKVQIAVTIVDRGGHVIQFSRMNQVSYMAADITRRKAVSALNFQMPSHQLHALASGMPALAQEVARNIDLCLLPGGIPLYWEHELVGAVGIGGAPPEVDIEIAESLARTISQG
jgi:glc operon protein GlcG